MNKKSETIYFTKVYDFILSNRNLTSNQKLLISYVLRWQESNKVCFESNKSLAKNFGITLSAIKKQITQLNKFDFFTSEETSGLNQFGKWSNSKEMKVDIKALESFLASKSEEFAVLDSTVIIKEKNTNKEVAVFNSTVIIKEKSTYDTLDEFSVYVDSITTEKICLETKQERFNILTKYGQPKNKENINRLFK